MIGPLGKQTRDYTVTWTRAQWSKGSAGLRVKSIPFMKTAQN